jgi:hypothetical protein
MLKEEIELEIFHANRREFVHHSKLFTPFEWLAKVHLGA